jgi:hypothetical protein
VSDHGKPIDEPEGVPIDPEAQQRELEAAGWERLERQGKVVWRHPESGALYPQGPAIRRLRMDYSAGENAPSDDTRGKV